MTCMSLLKLRHNKKSMITVSSGISIQDIEHGHGLFCFF